MLLHIGIDDTDSPRGGCTTYIAARIVEDLLSLDVDFIDYPSLIRLNPNAPWKTRGNGAICLRVSIPEELESKVKHIVIQEVEAYADLEHPQTHPGVVFHIGEIPHPIRDFAERTIRGLTTLREAMELIDEYSASAIGYKEMRGLIGALAAIGETLEGDYTYELLAYRQPENWGKPRRVDPESVVEMDRVTAPETFNNYDPETGRILITPRGPDPVLLGIRGESPEVVHRAFEMLRIDEPVERWVIFRTNQGTDAHLGEPVKLEAAKPYMPIVAVVEVASKPRTIPGGHVILRVRDETGEMDAAAYEPTGSFREIIRSLIPGDIIRIYGGVRPMGREASTINLEKVEILELARDVRLMNPPCPLCGARMESMGRGKGYRCRRCRYRDETLSKIEVEVPRSVGTGLYLPPPRAQRHLTKPLRRYGREKGGPPVGSLYEPWHHP